jgi:phosphoglycolate phosphatase-like HAD superfamily hydrolase
MTNTRAIFWDIDGTLLNTGRAGLIAWERAYADVTGATAFPSVRPDGLTDHQIGDWLLGQAAPATIADETSVARIVSRYEAHLVDALPLRQGRVLDNVAHVLKWLRDSRRDVLCWLLTGNTAAGGAAKLLHYGLSEYFDAGAFSERVEPRAEIARRAWSMARDVHPDLEAHEAVVIGDTPHDIECAHAIGARAMAVASHTHSRAELDVHHPWMLVDRLPDVAEFTARLFPRSSR